MPIFELKLKRHGKVRIVANNRNAAISAGSLIQAADDANTIIQSAQVAAGIIPRVWGPLPPEVIKSLIWGAVAVDFERVLEV